MYGTCGAADRLRHGLGGACFGSLHRRRKDPQAVDTAIGGSDNFNAQAGVIEHDDFAAERDAAFDLADQAAEGRRFIAAVKLDRLAE